MYTRDVHFIIYEPLGRGVSSSSRLNSFGKAFGSLNALYRCRFQRILLSRGG